MTDRAAWWDLVEEVAEEQPHTFPQTSMVVMPDQLSRAVMLASDDCVNDGCSEFDPFSVGVTTNDLRWIGGQPVGGQQFEAAAALYALKLRDSIRDYARSRLEADVKEWWERRAHQHGYLCIESYREDEQL